jgi:hypothetical protein
MPLTIEFTDTLEVTTCWCGINHAVPADLRHHQQRCHDEGRTVPRIYCPLGHTHVPAGEPKYKRIERERDAARNEAARQRAARDQAEASLRAQKAAATRAKKRHAAGTCPVCKRTFKQVQRHMASQHPDYEVTP